MKQVLYFIPVIVCIVLIILFSNCSKSINPIKNVASNSYFPNTVGSYWIYDVYDSSNPHYPPRPKQYSVTIKVLGTKTMIDGKQASMWQYEYPWEIDTNYIRIEGDTVKTFDKDYSSSISDFDYPRQIFILPFKDQTGWNGKLIGIDTFIVAKCYNISTSYISYDTCYNIYHYNYELPDLVYYDNYWFKPNIGFVKIYYKDWFAPYYKSVWNLKEYKLN